MSGRGGLKEFGIPLRGPKKVFCFVEGGQKSFDSQPAGN